VISGLLEIAVTAPGDLKKSNNDSILDKQWGARATVSY
jgi:hypothetical protein